MGIRRLPLRGVSREEARALGNSASERRGMGLRRSMHDVRGAQSVHSAACKAASRTCAGRKACTAWRTEAALRARRARGAKRAQHGHPKAAQRCVHAVPKAHARCKSTCHDAKQKRQEQWVAQSTSAPYLLYPWLIAALKTKERLSCYAPPVKSPRRSRPEVWFDLVRSGLLQSDPSMVPKAASAAASPGVRLVPRIAPSAQTQPGYARGSRRRADAPMYARHKRQHRSTPALGAAVLPAYHSRVCLTPLHPEPLVSRVALNLTT